MPNTQRFLKEDGFFDTICRGLRREQQRPILLRYLLPIVFVLLLVLFQSLPLVSFRTSDGVSDAASVFHWMHASVFGGNGSMGAFEALRNASKGNQNLTFYRSVIATYVFSVVSFAVGAVLTVYSSVGALYLLYTKEQNEQSHRFGRIYRVIWGDRRLLIVPYVLSIVPFLFPHFLAMEYTTFLSYASSVTSHFDPIIFALLVLFAEIVLMLWAKPYESRAPYHVFRSPHRRSLREERRLIEEREWEEEVRADAEDDPDTPVESTSDLDGESDSDTPHETESCEEAATADAPNAADPADEMLFDREFIVGEGENASASSSRNTSSKAYRETPQSEISKAALDELFSESDDTEEKKKKKGQ